MAIWQPIHSNALTVSHWNSSLIYTHYLLLRLQTCRGVCTASPHGSPLSTGSPSWWLGQRAVGRGNYTHMEMHTQIEHKHLHNHKQRRHMRTHLQYCTYRDTPCYTVVEKELVRSRCALWILSVECSQSTLISKFSLFKT